MFIVQATGHGWQWKVVNFGAKNVFWHVWSDVDGSVRNLGLVLGLGDALRLFHGQALPLSPPRKPEGVHGQGEEKVDQRRPRFRRSGHDSRNRWTVIVKKLLFIQKSHFYYLVKKEDITKIAKFHIDNTKPSPCNAVSIPLKYFINTCIALYIVFGCLDENSSINFIHKWEQAENEL